MQQRIGLVPAPDRRHQGVGRQGVPSFQYSSKPTTSITVQVAVIFAALRALSIQPNCLRGYKEF
jgi:hypothetical protein